MRPHILLDVLFPAKGNSGDYQPIAEVYLLILFAQSVVIGAIFILLPLIRSSRSVLRVPGRWSFLLYFAALGLGFIMVEMVLLQRFTLFSGQSHLYACRCPIGVVDLDRNWFLCLGWVAIQFGVPVLCSHRIWGSLKAPDSWRC